MLQGGELFHEEGRQVKKAGFYIIKDKFFEDMSDPHLKGNKAGNRPHYYCLEDTNTGIYWMIPLSSRIDKYRKIMEKKQNAGKPCDILHMCLKSKAAMNVNTKSLHKISNEKERLWQSGFFVD